MTIHEHLESIHACLTAREWAESRKTGRQCWDECERIDWIFWWASVTGQKGKVVECAEQISESVKHLNNYWSKSAAVWAAVAADAGAGADAAFAAAVAADAAGAAYAAATAAWAAWAAWAADAAVAVKQNKFNMSIAKKLLTCPFEG